LLTTSISVTALFLVAIGVGLRCVDNYNASAKDLHKTRDDQASQRTPSSELTIHKNKEAIATHTSQINEVNNRVNLIVIKDSGEEIKVIEEPVAERNHLR
jgi:hypothetical protein